MKSEGVNTPACVFAYFSIRARWKLTERQCNTTVSSPSCRGCCVPLNGCEEQRCVLAVPGRQAEGQSLECKVSLLTAGRNS